MKIRAICIAALLLAAISAVDVPGAADDRSTEVVRYDCLTDTTRREITLFGNGTVRVRDGLIKHEWMGLAEMGPDELQGFLNRLAGEDLSESQSPEKGVEGNWVERCELRLQLPGKPLKTFHFGHYDPLGLNLSRVVHIAEELGEKVQLVKDADALPADYVPEIGDVLKRVGDGALFRIVAFTSDKKGIELQGIDLPLEVYIPKDQVRQQFTFLVSKGW
ncbi:MAG: hypothetical protein JF614_29550 [Acidobacteria bacterium]|nr:hypothetical protein [Acidobacteriota bacterium]